MASEITQRQRAEGDDILEWAELVSQAYWRGRQQGIKDCLARVRSRSNRVRAEYEIRSIYKLRCDEAKLIEAALDRLAREGVQG